MLEPRSGIRRNTPNKLSVHLARSEAEVVEAQRLRYRVFAEEMGARLPDTALGVDRDSFDPWCEHLLVTDEDPGEVASLLTDAAAAADGMGRPLFSGRRADGRPQDAVHCLW